jgi:membrane protein implicated in regulation of membrane protease activity
MSPMQWVFLVLALLSALAELLTGTFYLAGVAAVALATYLLRFWVGDETLIFVFVGGCMVAAALVWVWHRRTANLPGLADFDAGQEVTVASVVPGDNRLTVSYRGTRWDAVLDDGPPPPIGSVLHIARKSGSVLHVVRQPVQETL